MKRTSLFQIRGMPLASLAVAAAMASGPSLAAPPSLAPLTGVDRPGTPWLRGGLPRQTLPWTGFSVVTVGAEIALQVEADNSYGNLLHLLPDDTPAAGRVLAWRWQLSLPNPGADLTRRDGDDMPIRVCAMFDMPLAAVPFFERQLLRLERERSGEPPPTATVCYVWDAHLPPGTMLHNAYTRRMRLIVLQGPKSPLQTWQYERRDLAADFLALFGQESRQVPPLLAITVGADADNTHARSQAQVTDLVLD